MNLRRHLPDFLRVLLTPSCWVTSDPYSPRWDDVLTRLMRDHTFEISKDGGHTAKLGPATLWVSNHPYSSFMPYEGFDLAHYRASRITTLRAGDKYLKDTGYRPGDQVVQTYDGPAEGAA